MKTFKSLLLLLVFTSTINADLNNIYHVGLSIDKFDKPNQNRVKRLIKKLSNELGKVYGSKIEVLFFDNHTNLLKEFRKYEKLNIIVIFPTFYLNNKDEVHKIAKNPFLFNNQKASKGQYYLVTNKKSEINSIKDLNNKSFAAYEFDDGYTIWADYLVRKRLDVSLESIIKKKESFYSKKKLLLNVYFNKSNFTVVPKVVYNDMLLLNPSIKKNLKIIKKSKPIFFVGIGFFHKKTPNELVEVFNKHMYDDIFMDKFQNIFTLLDLFGTQKISFDDIKDLDSYYDEYLKLKKE